MKHKTFSLFSLTILLGCSSANAAITISANNNAGTARILTTAEGVAYATGTGSLRIGYFLDPTANQLKSGDWNYIKNNFIPLGEGVGSLGDVTTPAGLVGNLPIPVPSGATAGKVSGQITGVTGTNLLVNPTVPSSTILNQGTRLFVLTSNSPDPATTAPTQFALVSDAIWLAPKDDPAIPGGASLTMALSIANLDVASASSELYWGTYDTVSASNFLRSAAAVPEPTISALFLLGAAVGFRRRR